VLEFVKSLIRSVLWESFLKRSFQTGSFDLLLIKGVSVYLKAIDAARKSVLRLILLMAALMMLIVGFVALHVGVFILAGWSLQTVGIITVCLGGAYFLIFGALMLVLTSERTWMKISKGAELVEKVTKSKCN